MSSSQLAPARAGLTGAARLRLAPGGSSLDARGGAQRFRLVVAPQPPRLRLRVSPGNAHSQFFDDDLMVPETPCGRNLELQYVTDCGALSYGATDLMTTQLRALSYVSSKIQTALQESNEPAADDIDGMREQLSAQFKRPPAQRPPTQRKHTHKRTHVPALARRLAALGRRRQADRIPDVLRAATRAASAKGKKLPTDVYINALRACGVAQDARAAASVADVATEARLKGEDARAVLCARISAAGEARAMPTAEAALAVAEAELVRAKVMPKADAYVAGCGVIGTEETMGGLRHGWEEAVAGPRAALLHAAAAAGDVRAARRAAAAAAAAEGVDDADAANLRLKAASRGDRPEAAFHEWDALQREGAPLGGSSYVHLLHACLRLAERGEGEEAVARTDDVLRAMRMHAMLADDPAVLPGSAALSVHIRVLCAAGQGWGTIEPVIEMLDNGVQVPRMCGHGVLDSGPLWDPCTRSAIVHAHVACGNGDAALACIAAWEADGDKVRPSAYALLARHFQAAGEPAIAAQLQKLRQAANSSSAAAQ